MGFFGFLIAALALMMVLEGLVYALFTAQVREMMRVVLTLPETTLRRFGAVIAGVGFLTLLTLSSGVLQLGN